VTVVRRALRLLPFTGAFVICAGGGMLFADRPTFQPYAYNHAVHTAKADCTLCHRGARDGARAGLPSLEVCTHCHATAPGSAPSARDRAVWAKALQGSAPPWNRLYRLPAHVFFSHRRHVTVAGVACETCHGDMEHQKTPPKYALKALKMRDCISCHQQEKVMVDCTGCHR
jgi:Cytochrome c7 and related cytochrome c